MNKTYNVDSIDRMVRVTALIIASLGIVPAWAGDTPAAGGKGAPSLVALRFATGVGAVTVGLNDTANGQGAVAIGNANVATGQGTVALGNTSQALGLGSLAFGDTATSYNPEDIAIGLSAVAGISGGTLIRDVAVGSHAVSTGGDSLALGDFSTASGNYSVAVGEGTQASGAASTALGVGSMASNLGGTALGEGAMATNAADVALGFGSVTAAPHTGVFDLTGGTASAISPASVVSVGVPGAERQIQNVAAGVLSATSTDAVNGSQLYSVAMATNTMGSTTAVNLGGGATYSPTTGVTAPGYTIGTTTYNSVGSALAAVNADLSDANGGTPGATGMKYFHANSSAADSAATGVDSVAVGPNAAAAANGGIAVGSGAAVAPTAANAVAIGTQSSASVANGVALGAGSVVNRAAQSAYTGAYLTAPQNSSGAVSVGSVGAERQITNVAAGNTATDAVNVSQLQAGVGSAVAAADSYTNQKLAGADQAIVAINQAMNSLSTGLYQLRKNAYSGIAGAMAMEPAPYVAGKLTYSAGVGTFEDRGAVGVGLRRTSDNGRWSLSGGVAASPAGVGGRLGFTGIID